MSLCAQCKALISKYHCPLCNNCYCLQCDSYIHSFPSKRTHLRKYITCENQINNTYQLNTNLNFEYLNNLKKNQNQIEKENIIFYSQNRDEIEFNNCYENDIYNQKINCLGNEIMDVKENFENKIEALHEQFHTMNENQKQKMNELNEKNNNKRKRAIRRNE